MATVTDVRSDLDRRYANVRAAMAEHSLDALVVAGSEYSGFEGAVTYLTGFQIVHRYAYAVVPADGDPFVVFPSEARYVGEHGTALIEQRFDPHPGAAIASHAKDAGWRRIGVYGLDYVMTVRDYRPLEGFDIVPFDVEFDLARAVKSDLELESVRDSVRINRRGFEVWAEAYAPGRTAAEVMAVAEEYFIAEGCGRLTMNMVLTAPGRSGIALPEFKIARKEEILGDFVLPSLEVAGPGMHWVEVSRAVAAEGTELSDDTKAMEEAYVEYFEAARDVDACGRDVPRRAHGGLEGLPRPRVPPRPCHRPLDRDDHDRVPEGGGGGRDGARGEHGALDAPPRDRRERRGLPLHAGHLARHRGGRRPPGGPADGDRRPVTLADGLVRNEDGVTRCWWGGGDHLEYRSYHDDEWGTPVTDDIRLFEKLSLEGFQAGLSWLTILRKREAFRQAFAGFDFHVVARYGARDVERLLEDASIVRHRGKIESTINNARRALELVEAEGSIAAFAWRFEPGPEDRPPQHDPRGAHGARSDGCLAGAREGAQAAGLVVRRPDDGVRVHAGHGPRERPSGGLRRPFARRGGPCRIDSTELVSRR